MPNTSAFATPEIERRYREFWLYGGRWFPLTDPEWDFVCELVAEAPSLRGLDCILSEVNRAIDVGALMDTPDKGELDPAERIMIAALIAYGTLPNFVWAGWQERLLEHLPSAGSGNLEVLTRALLKLTARREAALL